MMVFEVSIFLYTKILQDIANAAHIPVMIQAIVIPKVLKIHFSMG